ncbi:MAG: thioredoxin family protein [Candidatus Thalassarchaeaceae archaeon]
MPGPRGIEPGDAAPDFQLPNANSSVGAEQMSLTDVSRASGTVVLFTCNHCPYVVGSEERIEAIANKARGLGMGFAGINSNDPIVYESDNWDSMVKRASKGMTYAYLHDASQEIAHSYGAERTPEFYLLDGGGTVVYRGRLDDSPRNPMDATTAELAEAMDALAFGGAIANPRTDSIGCSVKWKQ